MAEGKDPIFILGCHRSGTSLLRSLLDGHPELNVVPVEGHYFEHRGDWIAYPLRQQSQIEKGSEAFLDSALRMLVDYDSSGDTRRDVNASGIFDVKRFQERMEHGVPEEGPQRMLQYFRALLEAAQGEVKEGGRWVEKSVEHFEFLPFLKQWFPKAHFVHIVRDPYANMVSLRNFRSRNGRFPFLSPLIGTLRWHRYHFLRWKDWMDRHYILHYEDLLTEPESNMKDLAENLGISFRPSLLEPTFLGAEWKGNRASGEKLKGLSKERTQAWKREITPVEHRLVNRGLGWMIEGSGYEKVPAPKGYWKKQKGEAFKTYLSNRLLKNYLEAPE